MQGFIGGTHFLFSKEQLQFAMKFEYSMILLSELVGKEEAQKKILEWDDEAITQTTNNFVYVLCKLEQEIEKIRNNGNVA